MYASKRKTNYQNWNTSKSRRSEVDTESEYEESKSETLDKSYNDYFIKLCTSINDVKSLVEKQEKIDTVIEYIKSIDSDSKNNSEALTRIYMQSKEEQNVLSSLDTMMNQYCKLTQTMNKIIIDHQHLKLESVELSKKIDTILSYTEYLYYKSVFVKEVEKEVVKEEKIKVEEEKEEVKEDDVKEEEKVDDEKVFKVSTRSARRK